MDLYIYVDASTALADGRCGFLSMYMCVCVREELITHPAFCYWDGEIDTHTHIFIRVLRPMSFS
jgi:hypothetical protein